MRLDVDSNKALDINTETGPQIGVERGGKSRGPGSGWSGVVKDGAPVRGEAGW